MVDFVVLASVFFVFGVLAAGLVESLTWQAAIYALLSLTVIRMLPVFASLLGTHLSGVSMLFAGWFGPLGLASIVLGLIVVAEAPQLAGAGQIELLEASAVLLSVLLHGVTAAPLSAAYARRVEEMPADAPEKREAAEMPTRVGSVPTSDRKTEEVQ